MARLDAPWMQQPDLRAFCALLEGAGHQALFVGGAVRNPLLGLAASDFDLATDATPSAVSALAAGAGLRVVPTGIDHGTVTVIAGPHPLEVTSFRSDVATDGRHATVAFGTDVAVDAQRRDFTMNAIYADIRGQLLDPTGGLPDLQARRVRFVGNPEARVQEDYLRILRFFRFTAWHGDPGQGIEPEGLAACAAHADGLGRISAERIGAEVTKLLAAPNPWPAVAAMAQSGVLWRVLPGAAPQAAQAADAFATGPDAIARLAWMGPEDPSDALRLSRPQARRWRSLRAAMDSGDGPGALGYRLGAADGWAAFIGRAAATEAWPTPEDKAALMQGSQAVFPIRAQDLPETGAALGARLKALEAAWIGSGFTASKDDLLT